MWKMEGRWRKKILSRKHVKFLILFSIIFVSFLGSVNAAEYTVRFKADYVSGDFVLRNVYYKLDGGSQQLLGTVSSSGDFTFEAAFDNSIRVFVNVNEGTIYSEELYIDGEKVACGNVGNEGLTYPGSTCETTPPPPTHTVRFKADYVSGDYVLRNVFYYLDGGSQQLLGTVSSSGDFTFEAAFTDSIRVHVNVNEGTVYYEELYIDGELVACGNVGDGGLTYPGSSCIPPPPETADVSTTLLVTPYKTQVDTNEQINIGGSVKDPNLNWVKGGSVTLSADCGTLSQTTFQLSGSYYMFTTTWTAPSFPTTCLISGSFSGFTSDNTNYLPSSGSAPFRISVSSNVGEANFASEPSGAEIWIDGSYTGQKTNTNVVNIPAGSHSYTLKLSGYEDYSGTFSVTVGQTTTVPKATLSSSSTSPTHTVRFKADYVSGDFVLRNVYYKLDGGSQQLLGTVSSSGDFTFVAAFTDSIKVHVNVNEGTVYYEELYIDGELVACGNVGNEGLTYPGSSCSVSPPEEKFKPSTLSQSKYIRSEVKNVYFDDALAEKYAPIFYIEADAKPDFSMQYYRIVESSEDEYIIQYLQVYPKQKPALWVLEFKPHRLDYSIVYIYVDKQGDITKIAYDAGVIGEKAPINIVYKVNCEREEAGGHRTCKLDWEDIPSYAKKGNQVILLIKDVYHTMKIPSQDEIDKAEKIELPSYQLFNRLKDENLKADYAYPNIGWEGKYMNSLGFDISDPTMVTKGVDDKIDVNVLGVQKEGNKLYVKIRMEIDSVLSLYLADRAPEKLTVYGFDGGLNLWQGHPVESGFFEHKFNLDQDLVEIPLNVTPTDNNPDIGLWLYAVVHKPPDGTGDMIKRNQIYHRIPEVAINTFTYIAKTVEVAYNENSPDKDVASKIIEEPEKNPIRLMVDNKIKVLVGGPLANAETAKYQDYFLVKVTNDYPGKNKGVIEVIDNPDGEGQIVLLAGTDRWGTKAAVEVFQSLDVLPTEPIFVDWNDGNPKMLE